MRKNLFKILQFLAFSEKECTPDDIAFHTNTPSTLLLEILRKKGYVQKIVSTDDSSEIAQKYNITLKGKKQVEMSRTHYVFIPLSLLDKTMVIYELSLGSALRQY